jgi:very-short-patch-repair endonuclease
MGVECDGASYHSAKSARDRDRLRQEVLEGLGWYLYRIWSTDWFNDPVSETKRLREVVECRLKELKKIGTVR